MGHVKVLPTRPLVSLRLVKVSVPGSWGVYVTTPFFYTHICINRHTHTAKTEI